ncbi:alpha-D-ribose 1-methylphosphonate 5-phosphate C-P-lyase PhnJ [Escherichia coli]|nr:alpha-D-ribose 1-methylphosphonate 5-phosphate C-P-lyase PhnJ [Escherichia coli]EJN8534664.1 alpha-D-ribose 1-methylphosphonate 5-phosphate C-P-lyase PhnJ [Escherichia coli]
MANLSGYNFAYLDEQTKRMIRRAILKAVAIPGYQVPFGGREMRIYAVPPFTRVESLDFDDHPFTVQQWNEPCAICGSTHSYLDEVVLDDAGNRMFVCSDTDYCRQQSEAKSQ